MIVGTVLCLGDSLTDGARAPSGYGYPEMLVDILNTRSTNTRWACLNRGVSGETTSQILRRTPGAVRELDGMFGAKWCVILAGTNDSKGGGCGQDGLDRWYRLWCQIVEWPLRYGIPTAVCTFPPVSSEMPEFTNRAIEWLNKATIRIRGFVADWIGRDGGPDGMVVPLRVIDLSTMKPSLLVDGVHLIQGGYAVLANRVADVIMPGPHDGKVA